MSPNCSHEMIVRMPSGVLKCGRCDAIDERFYGHWWPSVFDWAKPKTKYFDELLAESKQIVGGK